jgi:hypothetical protein
MYVIPGLTRNPELLHGKRHLDAGSSPARRKNEKDK